MKTFHEWFVDQPVGASRRMDFSQQVWEAATLAERERVLSLVESMYDRNTNLDWNDALEEVSFALRDHV